MPAESRPTRTAPDYGLPIGIVVSGWILSFLLWSLATRETRKSDESRFEHLSERVISTVKNRFVATEQALYGGRAILETGGKVTRKEWSNYVSGIRHFFKEDGPSFGYIVHVAHENLANFEDKLNSQR